MLTSIALLVSGWCAGWWLLWRVPRLSAPRPSSSAALAIVIPARNEADNLPGLLADLAAQDLAPQELVVVDDASSDDTAMVARALGATVIVGRPPPSGWTGKAWACQQGADATFADHLVFLDADVRLQSHALRSLVETHRHDGGLVSVAPCHHMVRPFERLSAPFNLVAFMGVGAARPGRRGRSDGAFGPCMICHRRDYDAAGGHAAVRTSVTDDLALAQSFADNGLQTYVYAGRGSIDYRMYPRSLGQLIEGWSKNTATGARFVPAWRAFSVALWITGLLVASQYLVLATLTPSRGCVTVAAVAFAAYAVQQLVFLRALTSARWLTAILFPLTAVAFVVIFVRSLWWTFVRRRVRWRGRDIDLVTPDHTIDLRPEV